MKWNLFSKHNKKSNQDHQLALIKTDVCEDYAIQYPPKDVLTDLFIKSDLFDSVDTDNISRRILDNPDFKNKYFIVRKIYDKRKKGVFIIKNIRTENKYLMKIKLNEMYSEEEVKVFYKLKTKKCKYIIKPYEFYCNNEYNYYVFEYYNSINLSKYINENKLKKDEIKEIFYQILCGVKFLHDMDIIHCDLKLDNILISNDKRIKIIDFDLSKISSTEFLSDNIFGTIQYIAPESYDIYVYSKKSDIWALGIILYALLTKKFPYDSEQFIENTHSNLCRRNKFKHPEFKKVDIAVEKLDFDESICNVLKGMLSFKDDERFDIDKVLEYRWI